MAEYYPPEMWVKMRRRYIHEVFHGVDKLHHQKRMYLLEQFQKSLKQLDRDAKDMKQQADDFLGPEVKELFEAKKRGEPWDDRLPLPQLKYEPSAVSEPAFGTLTVVGLPSADDSDVEDDTSSLGIGDLSLASDSTDMYDSDDNGSVIYNPKEEDAEQTMETAPEKKEAD